MVGEWRPTSALRFGYTAMAAAVAALMGALAIGSVVTAVIGAAPAGVAAGAVFYAPVAYVSGRLAVGCWRSRATIGPDGVVVVNPWRTWHVPLERVERFAAGPAKGGGGAAVSLLRTREGRLRTGYGPREHTVLWVTKHGATVFANTDKLRAALAPTATEMNDALERARALSGRPVPQAASGRESSAGG